jgi:Tfp pilus assembly protein PilN
VVFAAAAGSAVLRWRNAVAEHQAAALQAAATQAQSARARDAVARDAQERRLRQEALLRTLRRPGELAALTLAIDTALPPDAWLTGLVLRRDYQAAAATIGAGTSAAAPADAPPPGSIVELSGEAMSYEAVTAFLAQLGRAPGVAAVQLQSSGAGAEAQAIAFHAVVTLAWRDRS